MYANACTADASDFIWQHSAPVSNASEQDFIGHQIPDMPAEMTTPTAHKGHMFKAMRLDANPTGLVMMMTKAQS